MSEPHPRQIHEARVLVVEDESRMRELLLRAISGWGFEVSAARNGEEAIRLSDAHPFEIVLMDLNLPGIGGIDTLRRLREKTPHLQAIILTGFASIDAAKQAVHLDVVEFLTKPCHLGELEQALDRALRRMSPTPPAVLDKPDLPPATEGMTLDEVERQHILMALRRNNGNRTATATALGISRRTLYYKLEEYERQGISTE
jgi:DNA-binding NtrC family response regulator